MTATATQTVLSVDNLRTGFWTETGDVTAVDGVSFSVAPGEVLGVVGESGCGKSVTVESIMRLLDEKYTSYTGEVNFDGKNLLDLSEKEMQQYRGSKVGMIFQDPMSSLNPVYTVGEQIVEGIRAHMDLSKADAKARAIEMLKLTGIPSPEKRFSEYPHQLSGGMRQRVVIAMALACQPKLLIADEPTTALDVIVQKQILDEISALVAREGISLLMISHDLSVLAYVCEDLAVMRYGELVEVGPAAEVVANPAADYTRQLAEAFPTIGDRSSRLDPVTRNPARVTVEEPQEMTDEVVLRAQDLSVTFHGRGGAVGAVRDVNLDLRHAEILAVVGQSGSGKTTLARTLLGLQQPDKGSRVEYRGKRLGTKPKELREFRKSVQMVLQDPSGSLNPKLSVYESVAEGLRVQKFEGDERGRVVEALEAAELLPAERYLGSIPQELSGGQRQRVVIAGALALDPEILVADEPVASLDASVRGEILSLFLALRMNRGTSILVITHDLGLAWNIADTVAVMKDGRVVEYGPVENVLLDPQEDYTKELLAAVPTFRADRVAGVGAGGATDVAPESCEVNA